MDARQRDHERLRLYKELSRRMTPEERARATLELMRVGARAAKDDLRAAHPADSGEQIEQRYRDQCNEAWIEKAAGDGLIVRKLRR